MPPVTPRRGLKVRFAVSSPPGTEIVTFAACAPMTERRASVIIARGTGFIAGSPGGILSPGSVTVPTPSPPARWTR